MQLNTRNEKKEANMSQPAYAILHVNVSDVQQYKQYRALSSQAIAQHGAEVLVRGGEQAVLEGACHPRTVILKFASLEKAHAFYDSATYTAARSAREGAATVDFVIVQGV
jgi:uncharacterized protein (DUF1330 family)